MNVNSGGISFSLSPVHKGPGYQHDWGAAEALSSFPPAGAHLEHALKKQSGLDAGLCVTSAYICQPCLSPCLSLLLFFTSVSSPIKWGNHSPYLKGLL